LKAHVGVPDPNSVDGLHTICPEVAAAADGTGDVEEGSLMRFPRRLFRVQDHFQIAYQIVSELIFQFLMKEMAAVARQQNYSYTRSHIFEEHILAHFHASSQQLCGSSNAVHRDLKE
jgi:hypothetical protein